VEADFNIESAGILSKFSQEKSNLIPILQEFQQELGYLPEEVMQQIAGYLNLSPGTVYSVATFYAQFKFVPSGKKVVCVCRGTACHVRGGADTLREIEKRLGIKPGETTRDREYTLETVACIGACALAPTVTVNKETYGQMNPRKIAEVFGDRQ
jgi:NADH:ubiquinone oxidoreductase subunit E